MWFIFILFSLFYHLLIEIPEKKQQTFTFSQFYFCFRCFYFSLFPPFFKIIQFLFLHLFSLTNHFIYFFEKTFSWLSLYLLLVFLSFFCNFDFFHWFHDKKQVWVMKLITHTCFLSSFSLSFFSSPLYYTYIHTLSLSLSLYIYIYIYIYVYIYIYIIIMSCRQHGYPWLSLATSPYYSSPPAGLLGYILCPHIAAVCKFGLVVLLLLGHMWGSIGVSHLRARPCFSSCVRRVWLA